MPHFLDFLADRVLLCDGAMGTQVQARNPDIEHDYLGHENCTEILTESRPDMVREIHAGYLMAGSDAIQANSFGGSPITLAEFGLQDKAFALNKRSAEIAREAVELFAHASSWARSVQARGCPRSGTSPTSRSRMPWPSNAAASSPAASTAS
jgi:5-methyltetrahydrofolate--homocysteine methyltransferase